jgi:hypothetical protein
VNDHAADIVLHYRTKGLDGDSLRAAIERHQRILIADADVAAELIASRAVNPRHQRRMTPRAKLEARWASEEAERLARVGATP